MKKQWVVKTPDEKLCSMLENKCNLSPILAKLLVIRGIRTPEDVQRFLKPDFYKDQYSPFLLKNMKIACERIIQAIENKDKIIIYGDYDADGISATALLYNYFSLFSTLKKKEVSYGYILPDRVQDGYGMSKDGVEKANKMGAKLIITVDNGISSEDAVEYAETIGIDVIITDHHLVPSNIPKAYAIINPRLEDCEYPNKKLVGVGVAYKLIEALSEYLYTEEERYKVLYRFVDLVAIGTYQDVAKLDDENRLFVKYGIELLDKIKKGIIKTNLKGIQEILNLSDPLSNEVTHKTLGFCIGPRINASGRIETPDKAFEILVTTNEQRAIELAKELNTLNSKRQALKNKGVKEAINFIEENKLKDDKILFIESDNWHKGVIGLIASDVKELFYRPTIVITSMGEKNDTFYASCRSVEGFNIGEAISSLGSHCLSFGGHENAAGFSIKRENLEIFKEKLFEIGDSAITSAVLTPKINIELVINAEEISTILLDDVLRLEPFGEGNDVPIFEVKKVILIEMRVSKRGCDSLINFRKGIHKIFGVSFNNIQLINDFMSGDVVDISFKISKNKKDESIPAIEIIDMKKID